MKKNLIGCLLVLLLGTLPGCYKETDVAPDLYTSLGKVPQISVLWAGLVRPTTTLTVDVGSSVPITVEYTSEVEVKEIRLLQQTGTATPVLISTTTITPANPAVYDTKLRNFVVKVPIAAPITNNASVRIIAEVMGTNNLASAQRSVTVRTRA